MVFKSYLIVLGIVCVQLYFGTARLTESEVFGEVLKIVGATNDFIRSISNVDSEKIKFLMNSVNKFNKGPSSVDESKEGFFEILFAGTNLTKDEQIDIFTPSADTTQDVTEEKLHKKLAPEQASRILKIIHEIAGSSINEIIDGTLELMVHAINEALGKSDNLITKDKLRKFVDKKEIKAA